MLALPLLLTVSLCHATIYLHFPPGSNNRLFESTRERFNPFRLFNSRNPENGGYNVAVNDPHSSGENPANRFRYNFFYSAKNATSLLHIMWDEFQISKDVAIHDTNIILQYKCADLKDVDNIFETDAHEDPEYYGKCLRRERTLGLYTSDQKLTIDESGYSSATHTRQNPTGVRYGNECPEERDYYPYWHPSPWTDLAVFPKYLTKCSQYIANSFNVKPRFACLNETSSDSRWNNVFTCTKNGGAWLPVHNYQEIDEANNNEKSCPHTWARPSDAQNSTHFSCLITNNAPDCLPNNNQYVWSLPHFKSGRSKQCSIRIRLNVTSKDYNPDVVNSSFNHLSGKYISPVQSNYTLSYKEFKFVHHWSTSYLGATFQDRSHIFILSPRPESVQSLLHNINVVGKKGTMTSVYPAMTYNFHPLLLKAEAGDLIHIQWAGANTGMQESSYIPSDLHEEFHKLPDRHNFVQTKHMSSQTPLNYELTTFWNVVEAVWPTTMNAEDIALAFASGGYYMSREDYSKKPALRSDLAEAPSSFTGLVLRLKDNSKNQTFHFMCTCNNQLGFVDQKTTIVVK